MSLAVAAATTPSTAAPILGNRPGWTDWLDGQLLPDWRPGEWDRNLWLFTGNVDNPGTDVWKCITASCDAELNGSRRGFCVVCQKAWARSGQNRDGFAATHVRSRVKVPRGEAAPPCRLSKDGMRCVRPAKSRGLCREHYKSWAEASKWQGRAWEDWAAKAVPFTLAVPCRVPGCLSAVADTHRLCYYHGNRFRRGLDSRRDGEDPATWAQRQAPYLSAAKFSLRPLDEVLRREIVYGLQVRDRTGRAVVEPAVMRGLVRRLGRIGSLLDQAAGEALAGCGENFRIVGGDLRWAAQRGFEQFSGITATSKDVWDLRQLGLKCKTRTGVRLHGGTVNVSEVTQPWLRAVLQHWVETQKPRSDKFGRALRAVIIASRALQSRPGGGCDPARLQFADVSAVVDAFRSATRVDGSAVYSQAFRASLAGEFFALLDFGRQAELLDNLSGAFSRNHAVHRIKVDHGNEDEIGKAIPEPVLAQLEEHLHLLGDAVTGRKVRGASLMRDADRKAMYRTVFVLLRDTGRRPEEIAALPRDCLEVIRAEVSLIWNNHKGGRHRRRLPITTDTAQAIRDWQAIRDQIETPADSGKYLFPALTWGSGTPHMPSGYISEAIRAWVAAIPHLDGEGTDAEGNRLPFDRSLIFPYAFRHTYAQRHADAGTSVDVLKELMDHRSISTTMGYYQVSLKRKQAAVKTLAAQAIDRSGQSAPFSSGLAYERGSVAVPFGGCTEPSNIKAGGNSCPIRFQCAGCGFYRPDPSYLPAIEQHINDLRADRETAMAMDAASFVITSLTGQIEAYTEVAATMRQRLAAMPGDERAEIEQASAIMRRTRAAGRTMLPLSLNAPDDS